MSKIKLRGKRLFAAQGRSAMDSDNKNGESRESFWKLHQAISKLPQFARRAFLNGYCGSDGGIRMKNGKTEIDL